MAETKVSEADVIEHLHSLHQPGSAHKKLKGLLHRQPQHFMNIKAVVLDLQHRGLEASALAIFTNQFHVGEELHLHSNRSVALTSLATSARYIERKMSGGVAALIRLRSSGK